MLLVLNIILSLITISNNESIIDISHYLNNRLRDYNKIDYKIISPKEIDLSACTFDDSRDFRFDKNYAYIPVQFEIANKKYKQGLITLKLKLYKNVLVSQRKIRRKELFDTYDFTVVEKEVSTLRFEPLTNVKLLNNLRAKYNISSNSILQKNMVEQVPDIKIGDRLEAIFSKNIVSISFMATARSEGVVGDIIKIKRDDKKIFKAKIISNNTVKIIE